MARWAKCFLGKHEVPSLDPAQLLSAFTIPELEEGADTVRPRGLLARWSETESCRFG